MTIELFHTLVRGWLALAGVIFVALLIRPAPYGRYLTPAWGPTIPARLAWTVMELPAALTPLALFIVGQRYDAASSAFLALWLVHYFNRALIFPRQIRKGSHSMPLLLIFFGILFNLANGGANGGWLFVLGPTRDAAWLLGPRFICGALLFLAGFAVNIHADRVLFELRDRGVREYEIPRGGLFRYVSCPNYLGEIVEWLGWALLTWSPAGLAFAAWTVANLAPRALSHHRWYRERFGDYPERRRALIPFVV